MERLLVRIYDVGFGDCIYVRIPDKRDHFHMLIDCGTSAPARSLGPVVDDVFSMLPRDKAGRASLDLLVATHPHADHIKGFDLPQFREATIRRIWLTIYMNPFHVQAKNALTYQSRTSASALKALREDLAMSSSVHPDYPLYVARDLAQRLNEQERCRHKLALEQGATCFRGFQESNTRIRVLAPEWDIDRYYLGLEPVHGDSAARQRPLTAGDPRQLGRRVNNNTSVVLLLDWRGRRLLFPGDAEWQGTGFGRGRANGSWDVMLAIPEVEEALLQPLDLFKVTHHGSHNGTPFLLGGKERVLDKMVTPDRTWVVVSTYLGLFGGKTPVPYPPLMKALGGLAANKRRYQVGERDLQNVDQPQRTDLEPDVRGKQVRYVEVMLDPASD